MDSRKSSLFNSPVVVAASILSLGMISAALIDSHKPGAAAMSAPPAVVLAPPPAVAAMPPEADLRQNFISQMQSQFSGQTTEMFGKKQTFDSASVDSVKYATQGDEIEVAFELHWKPGAWTGTSCTLTKDNYGHWTNAYDFTVADTRVHPQIDIQ